MHDEGLGVGESGPAGGLVEGGALGVGHPQGEHRGQPAGFTLGPALWASGASALTDVVLELAVCGGHGRSIHMTRIGPHYPTLRVVMVVYGVQCRRDVGWCADID